MKNFLIICDSHGTKWGAIGYAWQIKKTLNKDRVDILEYGGVSLSKIYKEIQSDKSMLKNYDVIIIGIGNPDIHPRMPKFFIEFLKKIGLSFVRDSYFSIPPVMIFSYFIRMPFFLFRLLMIRFIDERYLSNQEVLENIQNIVEHLKYKTKKVILLPLWNVNQTVYTRRHNENAKEINSSLKRKFPKEFFESEIFKSDEYKKYYNYDGFHFKNFFHEKLSKELILYLKENENEKSIST